MIDELIQKKIAAYLPNPPDPELEINEYYYLQETAGGERVIKVFALDILPHGDDVEYGIYQCVGGRLKRIDSGFGDMTRGVRQSALYDNYQDCKGQTHLLYSGWEELRRIQTKGGEQS